MNAGNRGKGRPKGSANKATAEIKAAIVEAFEKAGGVDYLVKVASDDPRTFCGLIGKVIPLQVTGEGGGAVQINIVRFADQSAE